MAKKLTSLSDLQNILLDGEKQELKMDEKKRQRQLEEAKNKLLTINKTKTQ